MIGNEGIQTIYEGVMVYLGCDIGSLNDLKGWGGVGGMREVGVNLKWGIYKCKVFVSGLTD